MSIILASKSPRRRDLLETLDIKFKTFDPDVDEQNTPASFTPEELVMGLALRKARAAAEKFDDDDDIIIGADTIVWYDGIVLGKPEDEADAFRMLTMLSGDYHEVYTGIALIRGDKLVLDCDVTRVKMRDIDADEIEEYIESGEPFDKAGGYGIQEMGGVFVEKIEGNYHNVVGLPLCMLCNHLKDSFGFSPIAKKTQK